MKQIDLMLANCLPGSSEYSACNNEHFFVCLRDETTRKETPSNETKRNKTKRNKTKRKIPQLHRKNIVRAATTTCQSILPIRAITEATGHKNLPGRKNCVASPYLAVSRPKMLLVAENKYLRVFRSDWIFEHRILTSVQISNQIEKRATPIIRYPLGNKVLPRGVTNSK